MFISFRQRKMFIAGYLGLLEVYPTYTRHIRLLHQIQISLLKNKHETNIFETSTVQVNWFELQCNVYLAYR